jgi:addiction module HigA family antidote
MPRITQSPGTVLTNLLKKHKLNYNRLAKAIGLSSAMIRLIARDENPVSASVACRLARFFNTSPESWQSLQLNYEIAMAEQDKKLAKELKEIPTVDKATFVRKPKTKKTTKITKQIKTTKGKKTTKPKKVVAKKSAVKKSVKAGAPKKYTKAAAPKNASSKKPTTKRPVKTAKTRKTRNSTPSQDMTINEPMV